MLQMLPLTSIRSTTEDLSKTYGTRGENEGSSWSAASWKVLRHLIPCVPASYVTAESSLGIKRLMILVLLGDWRRRGGKQGRSR